MLPNLDWLSIAAMLAPELQPTESSAGAPAAAGRLNAVDTDLRCEDPDTLCSDDERLPVDPKFHHYIHHPPDPEAAEAIAKAKRPCLKSPEERNPKWNPWLSKEGTPIAVEGCEDLVAHMTWKGHWALVLAETYRTVHVGPARTCVMEFVVPRNGTDRDDIALYTKEINLAGYTHWSLCSQNGWEPFSLPNSARGWGKEVTDYERLAHWHSERMFSLPMPHHAGDGWLCRAKHYTKAEYPKANQHGPLGDTGPVWATFV